MARFAIEQWLPAHPEGVLRLLSLPCSTGEEPYTMAMALIEAGFPAGRFRIDAFDISEKVIGHAREGVYGRNSFRGTDLAFRDRFFEAVGNGHRLSAAVRENVQFAQGNLMDPMFGQSAEYDIVFCRNLLIYFDAADQARAVATLRRMLAADGMFFVGHSESGILIDKGFESARIPLAFAFRRAVARPATVTPPVKPVAMPRPRPSPVAPRPRAAVARPAPTPNRTVAELPAIQRLADQGRLAEAETACEAYIGWHGPSAEALYLLGVICDAAGQQARAADCYRKVLYLDPFHHEALNHLALLLERRGDVAGARRLTARTARLQQSEGR
jgi:chemotaxis protein methyltransferase WspC